jgi:hypothetical protein
MRAPVVPAVAETQSVVELGTIKLLGLLGTSVDLAASRLPE